MVIGLDLTKILISAMVAQTSNSRGEKIEKAN